jgi:glycerol kinase
MAADGARPEVLRIDGGMVVNDWLCQCLADLVEVPVERPALTETTAFGAACLAGLATGVHAGPDAVRASWSLDRRFEPALAPERVEERLAGWRSAVARSRSR